MTVKQDSECKDFVVLPLSDFIKLNSIAKTKEEAGLTVIKTNDLLFLSAVMKELTPNYSSELSIMNNTVTIKVHEDDGTEINSVFALELCEKYYGKVSRFIAEIL